MARPRTGTTLSTGGLATARNRPRRSPVSILSALGPGGVRKMHRPVLENKPLVEAIFELRWDLDLLPNGMRLDPHYRILVGKICDRAEGRYPFHEQLPAASLPDEVASYVVQHRFRAGDSAWPLIQLGPGVVTLNATEDYVWGDFVERIRHVLTVLYDAHPAGDNLGIQTVLLRYIDGIDFDYDSENVFAYVRDKMKIGIDLYDGLFEDTGVQNQPLTFDVRFTYASTKPSGAVILRLVRGKRNGVDSIVWETTVQASENDAPTDREGVEAWVLQAHELTDDWFFKIIDGDLLRRFE